MSGYGLAGHFLPAWLSSDSSSFVNCRAIRPTGVRVSPSAPLFECGVASAECGMKSGIGCKRLLIPHFALSIPHLKGPRSPMQRRRI